MRIPDALSRVSKNGRIPVMSNMERDFLQGIAVGLRVAGKTPPVPLVAVAEKTERRLGDPCQRVRLSDYPRVITVGHLSGADQFVTQTQ